MGFSSQLREARRTLCRDALWGRLQLADAFSSSGLLHPLAFPLLQTVTWPAASNKGRGTPSSAFYRNVVLLDVWAADIRELSGIGPLRGASIRKKRPWAQAHGRFLCKFGGGQLALLATRRAACPSSACRWREAFSTFFFLALAALVCLARCTVCTLSPRSLPANWW